MSAPHSSPAARCCRSTRASCSAARSAVRSRRGMRRAGAVIDEVGELVITEPMPSMPLFLWGDPDGERLRESYFEMFPGVWRHGDWIRITAARRRGHLRALGCDDQSPGSAHGHERDLSGGAARSPPSPTRSSSTSRSGDGDGELWMILFVVLARAARSTTSSPPRSGEYPRGLLAAACAQRGPPDRRRCRAPCRARCWRSRSSGS